MDKLASLKSKILTDQVLKQRLAQWRFRDLRIVFTNGCFDILHRGHVEYLAKASEYGDILLVGLNTDDSVKKIKGPDRPVQDQHSRALILASLSFISAIVLFEEDTPLKLIEKVQPDILVKGADYKAEDIVGYDIVRARGGQIITIDITEGQSSSVLINKLSAL